MAGKDHEASEDEAAQVHDAFGQRRRRFGRLHAATLGARVEFDDHVYPAAVFQRLVRYASGRDFVIDGHDDLGPPGDTRQAFHLAGTDDVVGDQDVFDAGGGHDFRLAEFLAADSDRAGPDLPVGDFRDLVALGMASQADVETAAVFRHGRDVPLHHVQVGHVGRGVQFVDVHGYPRRLMSTIVICVYVTPYTPAARRPLYAAR